MSTNNCFQFKIVDQSGLSLTPAFVDEIICANLKKKRIEGRFINAWPDAIAFPMIVLKKTTWCALEEYWNDDEIVGSGTYYEKIVKPVIQVFQNLHWQIIPVN